MVLKFMRGYFAMQSTSSAAYDLLTVLLSLADVTTDIIVALDYHAHGETLWCDTLAGMLFWAESKLSLFLFG